MVSQEVTGLTVISAGQVIVGASDSNTNTLNWQVLVFPKKSVAS